MPGLVADPQIQSRTTPTAKVSAVLLVTLFSLVYFVDVFVRSSGKTFWFDEMFTLSFARLGSLSSLWAALKSGVDFNPPSFYLLTHLSQQLFGDGLIGTRLPEIIGFWILSLCLFRFVYRRAGLWGGLVAMILPALSGAFYYAYEARPHAIVLGFCGLALVSWQLAQEDRSRSSKWLILFSLSLLGAFFMHCFALVIAVPFGLAEVFRTFQTRCLRWRMWIALLAPSLLACLLYVPLLLSFRKANGGGAFNDMFPASWIQVQHFYISLLSRSVVLIVLAAVLFAADRILANGSSIAESEQRLLDKQEVVLGFAFLALPVFGIALAKVIHGPFFARYFLSALLGVCFMIGIGIGRSRRWAALSLGVVCAAMLLADVAGVLARSVRNEGEYLLEPSTRVLLNAKPGDPFGIHPVLKANWGGSEPVGVLNSLEYLYLVHYAPQLRSRLYFITRSRKTLEYGGLSSYRPWSADPYNQPMTFEDFARGNPHFLIYGEKGMFDRVARFTRLGSRLDWLKADEEHFLAGMQGISENRQ